MKIINRFVSMILLLGLLSGCSETMTASADEMVTNVLDASKKTESYYGEGEIKVYEGDKLTGSMVFKDYTGADGKRKYVIEDLKQHQKSVSVNNGENVITYEEGGDTAYSMSIKGMPSLGTPKEQFTQMLEAIKKTHSYQVEGEEEILGLKTHHIKASAKSKDSILGDMEFWVDQKTWFVVKSITNSGESRSELEYKKLDFSPDFSEKTFKLDLPKHVKIKSIEEENKSNIGTVEEAEAALGQPFLLFNDRQAKLGQIVIDELKGEINRTEVTISYLNDQSGSFTLSIFPTPEGEEMKIGKSSTKVRGFNAEKMDEINSISWDENGLRYTIIVKNPDLSVDEVIKMTDQMKLSSEK
ncbi:LolA family protein [Niallia sp. 01092]|uniref:LolA family protein n=1 Tax=unclassified Niallia TaxID=2837522 RepID=UPI003FD45FF5